MEYIIHCISCRTCNSDMVHSVSYGPYGCVVSVDVILRECEFQWICAH